MSRFLLYFLACALFENVSCKKPTNVPCKTNIYPQFKIVDFTCTNVRILQNVLNVAKRDTTSISIIESNLPHIAMNAFVKFGATLEKLDLHNSQIKIIDRTAFRNLRNLKVLILWGNNLETVWAEWFADLPDLHTLDISFNFITTIEMNTYQRLRNLENFYFDYNKLDSIDYDHFAYLSKLKRVRFGKNPWRWSFRAKLTWQMAKQGVDYSDNWEDWSWMNAILRECDNIGYSQYLDDKLLNCAIMKLLDFAETYLNPKTIPIPNGLSCGHEANELVRCVRPRNTTENNDLDTIRLILQDYSRAFTPMERSITPFHYRSYKL